MTTTKQVQDARRAVFQLTAENLPPHPTGADVDRALETALLEWSKRADGVVVGFFDARNGLQLNIACTR